MLCNAYNRKEREKEYINMLQRNKVDGIIIGSHTLEIEDYLKIKGAYLIDKKLLTENYLKICEEMIICVVHFHGSFLICP